MHIKDLGESERKELFKSLMEHIDEPEELILDSHEFMDEYCRK